MPTSSVVGRVAAILALIGAVAVMLLLVLGGGSSYTVTAEFENASQLVTGNNPGSTPPASESGQFPLSSLVAPLTPSFIAPTLDATATPTPPGGPSAFAPCTIAPNFPAAFGGGKIPEVLSDP